jgi:ferredoxin
VVRAKEEQMARRLSVLDADHCGYCAFYCPYDVLAMQEMAAGVAGPEGEVAHAVVRPPLLVMVKVVPFLIPFFLVTPCLLPAFLV